MANQNKTNPAPDRQDWGDRFAPVQKALRKERLQVLLTESLMAKLDEASREYGLSKNEIINRALDAFLE